MSRKSCRLDGAQSPKVRVVSRSQSVCRNLWKPAGLTPVDSSPTVSCASPYVVRLLLAERPLEFDRFVREISMATAPATTQTVAAIETSTIRKLQRRILPFVFLLYVVSFLDRINIGFAALTMNRDLASPPNSSACWPESFHRLLSVRNSQQPSAAQIWCSRLADPHHHHVGTSRSSDGLRPKI